MTNKQDETLGETLDDGTNDEVVFGPYAFSVDYRGYSRWYASRGRKELKKGFAILAGFSTVFMLAGAVCLILLLLGVIGASERVAVWLLFGFCLVQWLLALVGLAHPRMVLASQRSMTKRWFAARGVNVEAMELAQPDIRQWSVFVRSLVTPMGVEEHLADDFMVRLPFAVLNAEPEVIDDALCYRVASDKEAVTLWTLLDKQIHFPQGLVNDTVVIPFSAFRDGRGNIQDDIESFRRDMASRIRRQRDAVIEESAASVTGTRHGTPLTDEIVEWAA